MRVFDETLASVFVGGAACAIGVVPIHQRIVKAETQAFRASSFDVFMNKVAAGALLCRAVVGELGVKVAETFVMLGSQHHIFLAGLFGELGPGARGICCGLVALGELLIGGHGDC